MQPPGPPQGPYNPQNPYNPYGQQYNPNPYGQYPPGGPYPPGTQLAPPQPQGMSTGAKVALSIMAVFGAFGVLVLYWIGMAIQGCNSRGCH